ncbi:hypothetical protein ACFVFH_05075 [Streptomyces sp. NPDC057697]|uniref:hypothetical protein n=1 Tax=Streptomyces sp. NPDC057697 TaxID=3346219 RepID=UPI0036AE03BA
MMRQHIKLSAVLVVVVLALTGFSTHGSRSGKSKSRGSSSSSSGGGCSNSHKSNGNYHRTDYDDDDDYGSSSSSSGSTDYETATPDATSSAAPQAYVVRCAQPRKGKRKAVTTSTVRLAANTSGAHTYTVDVTFLDARGGTVDTGYATVDAEGGQEVTLSVPMGSPGKVSRVRKCRVEAEMSY